MLGQIDGSEVKIASRWSRFWAWFLDGLIAAAIMVVLFYFEPTRNLVLSNAAFGPISSLVFSAVLYLLCHGYLLNKYGQTIGKNVFEIAIVSMDNQLLSLSKIFFMRWVPFTLMVFVPTMLIEVFPSMGWFKLVSLLGLLAGTVNILFIFGKQRRCLHDRLAGTKVVDVSKPRVVDFREA